MLGLHGGLLVGDGLIESMGEGEMLGLLWWGFVLVVLPWWM